MKEDKQVEEEDTPEDEAPQESSLDAKLDKINKAAAALKIENDRAEEIAQTRAMNLALSGKADAGYVAPPPKKLTDEEYADKLLLGEVNPLKDDGFLK